MAAPANYLFPLPCMYCMHHTALYLAIRGTRLWACSCGVWGRVGFDSTQSHTTTTTTPPPHHHHYLWRHRQTIYFLCLVCTVCTTQHSTLPSGARACGPAHAGSGGAWDL